MSTDYAEREPGQSPRRRPFPAPGSQAVGAADHAVVCVKREKVEEGYTRIAQLGIRRGDKVELLQEADVVQEVRRGARFYVGQGPDTAFLRVNISDEGHPYVESRADASLLNNLSALPVCDSFDSVPYRRARSFPAWAWIIPFLLLAALAYVVIVNLGPVQITWPMPADILYGAKLGPDQLNAIATAPGEFDYQPGTGALLDAGDHQPLNATFHRILLPSPLWEIALLLGLLALLAALVLTFMAWRRRQPRRASKAAAYEQSERRRKKDHDEHDEDRERGRVRRRRLLSGLALLLVLLALGGMLAYYLAFPSSAVAQQFINVRPAVAGISWDNPQPITYPAALSDVQLNAKTDVPGELKYGPAAKTVLRAGTGQPLSVNLTPSSHNYTGAAKTVYIDVNKGTPQLTWQQLFKLVYGTGIPADLFSARSSVSGTITYRLYTPTAGLAGKAGLSALTASGVLPAPGRAGGVIALGDLFKVGQYTLVADFHPGDDRDWNDASITASLTVGKRPVNIDWQQPAAVTYPTALSNTQYNFTVVDQVPGKPTLMPPLGVTPDVGDQTLSVNFQPDDNTDYDPATQSVTLRVLPGTPLITWRDPADVVYKTHLGPAQLNATANVPGTFTYTPVAGTVLEAGNHQALKVDFHPDSKNYQDASKTVYINVTKKNSDNQSHDAQFLKNGDFEGGFTVSAPAAAVGTHWCYFNNGDYRYGYYDDQWEKVWYNPSHSQLIEIGSATYDPGERPNRFSGICQTVSGLIPGRSYTLTLHGLIRVSEGDPNTDNASYVVEWGLGGASAAWQNVSRWHLVPWTHVYPYLSAGPVQSYVTEFTAPADTATLFIRLLKEPGTGNTELNLNLDGLTLVGPTYDPNLNLNSH